MDPNETLARIRTLRKELIQADLKMGDDIPSAFAEMAMQLEELVGALDGYLSIGGFLPTKWKNALVPPFTASKVRG